MRRRATSLKIDAKNLWLAWRGAFTKMNMIYTLMFGSWCESILGWRHTSTPLLEPVSRYVLTDKKSRSFLLVMQVVFQTVRPYLRGFGNDPLGIG